VPVLGRLLRWRVPGTNDGLAYRELFRTYPFVSLGEGPGWFMSGLCGQIWTLKGGYPRTLKGGYPRLETTSEFTAWREPRTVRVLFAHWVEPLTEGGSEIRSEARVEPVDRRAPWKLGALCAALGRFESLVGREVLNSAVQRSERRKAGHRAARCG
jgi:hypothetical protein